MATTPTSAPHAAAHLRLDGVSVSFGSRRVLTDVSFTVPAGERTGLIGENGSGKTTLLRVAAGLLRPHAGTVTATVPGGRRARVGLLRQRPPFPATASVADALESAVISVRAAAYAVDAAASTVASHPDDEAALTAYTRALETAERLGAWDVDVRIATMLAGLGLSDVPRGRSAGSLSDGQRSRLALAWLLLSAPDVLLLDEPTNHLDDAATEHLRRVLVAWTGPVLAASHDRAFLDEVATSLVDLDPAPVPHVVAGPLLADGGGASVGITRFSGTYTDHLRARADARTRWERRFRDEQADLRRLRAAVVDSHVVGHEVWSPRTEGRAAQKFYSDRNARAVSRRVDDARARLARLEQAQLRRPPRGLTFRGLTAGAQSALRSRPGPVLTAAQVGVAGRLSPTSLTVGAGERWLVTGPNGSGKSTLLHLLAGDLPPTSGSLSTAGSLRIGLLAQEIDLPDVRRRGPRRTARQTYADLVGAEHAAQVPLSNFGLVAPRDEHRPVRALSMGQQRRLALAVLLAHPPDVLLLDEPTNHLSPALVTELETAIVDYPGAVVVASHDRWMRRTWSGRRLDLASD